MEPTRDWGGDRPQRRQEEHTLPRRTETLEKGLAMLEEAIDRLSVKVEPILGPERPSAALSGSPSDPDETSDLGRRLDSYAERLGMLTGRLAYLTDRIDL